MVPMGCPETPVRNFSLRYVIPQKSADLKVFIVSNLFAAHTGLGSFRVVFVHTAVWCSGDKPISSGAFASWFSRREQEWWQTDVTESPSRRLKLTSTLTDADSVDAALLRRRTIQKPFYKMKMNTNLELNLRIQHFNIQLMHTTLKNVELLKHFKVRKTAPTCFGLQGNHHQGARVST